MVINSLIALKKFASVPIHPLAIRIMCIIIIIALVLMLSDILSGKTLAKFNNNSKNDKSTTKNTNDRPKDDSILIWDHPKITLWQAVKACTLIMVALFVYPKVVNFTTHIMSAQARPFTRVDKRMDHLAKYPNLPNVYPKKPTRTIYEKEDSNTNLTSINPSANSMIDNKKSSQEALGLLVRGAGLYTQSNNHDYATVHTDQLVFHANNYKQIFTIYQLGLNHKAGITLKGTSKRIYKNGQQTTIIKNPNVQMTLVFNKDHQSMERLSNKQNRIQSTKFLKQ